MRGWGLLGPVFAAIIGALLIERAFALIVGATTNTAVNAGRTIASVSTWSTIVSVFGIRSLRSKAGKLGKAGERLENEIKDRLPPGEGE